MIYIIATDLNENFEYLLSFSQYQPVEILNRIGFGTGALLLPTLSIKQRYLQAHLQCSPNKLMQETNELPTTH